MVTVTRGHEPVRTQPGVKIADAARQTLAYGDTGTAYKVIVQRDFADQQDGTYYVLIGSDYGSQSTRDTVNVNVFKFKAQGGEVYQFKARPTRTDGSIDLSASNDDGVNLGSGGSPNKGAVATLDKLSLPKDGYIYVKVQYGEWSSKTGHYGIALGQGQVDSPHPPTEP